MREPRKILMIAAFVALALVSLAVLAGCGGSTPAPGTGTGSTGSGATGSGSGSGAGSSAVAVSLKNFAFDPAEITVAVGGTVTFTNNDTATHNVAGDGWSSGNLAPGATFSQTFPTAGTFPIKCTIHPSMTANVTVK